MHDLIYADPIFFCAVWYKGVSGLSRSLLVVAKGIGAALKDARVRAGLSQSDLSRAAGVAPNIISRIEAGERTTPSFQTVARLAACLGLSLDAISASIGIGGSEAVGATSAVADLHSARRSLGDADVQMRNVIDRLTAPPKRRR